jgi:UDP-glucose 4-epimerase
MSRPPLTWVIGSGGLLGSNVEQAMGRRGPVWRIPEPIRWTTSETGGQLARAAQMFATAAQGRPWQVAWCAGAGVMATTVDAFAEEADVFGVFLDALSETMPARSDGAVFFASSAGGLYAGSPGPPFTEDSVVRPTSPYGDAKLREEQIVSEWADVHDWPVVIGRIANLYGAGQNLAKPQGLISQICRAHLLRQPISIYVPLDTVRDYLYARDCGDLVAAVLDRGRRDGHAHGSSAHVKILASQRGVTIGAVLAELRRVLKQRVKVIHGLSATAKFQARDLRLRSVVWPDLDRRALTPLPAGIRATLQHLTWQFRDGSLRA